MHMERSHLHPKSWNALKRPGEGIRNSHMIKCVVTCPYWRTASIDVPDGINVIWHILCSLIWIVRNGYKLFPRYQTLQSLSCDCKMGRRESLPTLFYWSTVLLVLGGRWIGIVHARLTLGRPFSSETTMHASSKCIGHTATSMLHFFAEAELKKLLC